MKVFKFGGASAASIERINHIPKILKPYSEEKLLVVISAMGKTTNALEKVLQSFYEGKKEEALLLFNAVKQSHLQTAKYLLVTHYNEAEDRLSNFFTEVEWLLHDKPSKSFDYYYDQIVCIGELLSTTILSAFLNQEGAANEWIDVRDIFRTDDNFRDANIDWAVTEKSVAEKLLPLFEKQNLVITQGFIASTDENESTTLGREGSDYSAAVFAAMLSAESQTIWKDVEGFMNADPKEFPEAVVIPELNYEEVIEMAYYGAQVIHPKTIKPLRNHGIPLYVKSFLDPSLPGTLIHEKYVRNLPPIFVLKKNQVLLHLQSRDFSFVGEKPVARLYEILSQLKIKPNLMQTGAVNLMICVDEREDKLEKLAGAIAELFDLNVEKGLTLLTIRHGDERNLNELTKGRRILLKQQTKETAQVLVV